MNITSVENGWNMFQNVSLVRGVSKRAIRVVLRPFSHGVERHWRQAELITMAAEYAAKRGWKTIIVEPGLWEDDATVFNPSNHHESHCKYGTYLCDAVVPRY